VEVHNPLQETKRRSREGEGWGATITGANRGPACKTIFDKLKSKRSFETQGGRKRKDVQDSYERFGGRKGTGEFEFSRSISKGAISGGEI